MGIETAVAVVGAISGAVSAGATVKAEQDRRSAKKKSALEERKLKEAEEEKQRQRLAGIQRSEGTLTGSQGVMENAQVGRKELLGQ
ncbi:MAG: hypothetical protein U9O94_02375 [Nanoarchaeota archaeon]|nr:hypothetical protein [Nanoarchaeota archaeon]